MNKVNITIENCYDCPHSKFKHNGMYNLAFGFLSDEAECFCGLKNNRLICRVPIKINRTGQIARLKISIPEWCPMIASTLKVEDIQKDNTTSVHTVYLKDLNPGDHFYFVDSNFILLEKYKSACRAIRETSWRIDVFDHKNLNNLKVSFMKNELERYNQHLNNIDENVKSQMMVQQIILQATDRSDDYGEVSSLVGLLTLEQYGRYKKYLEKDDVTFWLATPHEPYSSSIGEKCVWVAHNGMINPAPVSTTAGIRPVIMLATSTKVDVPIRKEQENATTSVK